MGMYSVITALYEDQCNMKNHRTPILNPHILIFSLEYIFLLLFNLFDIV
jgi:hypothetical protein